MKTSIKLAFFSFLLIFLAACEESSFLESQEDNVSFGGIVVDGYISGATVCLDLNNNDSCDNTEPRTTSDENGIFSFSSRNFNDYTFVPVIAVGGVDTATNKAFEGELKTIIDTSVLVQDSQIIINPLTDLVSASFLRATNKNKLALSDAIQEVADVFGITEADVLKDPMQNVALFAKVQEIQHLKEMIFTSANKTYIADNGKDLLLEIKEALVTQIKDSSDGVLNLERVLLTVEIQLGISIPDEEKIFIISQIAEIKRVLDIFVQDTTVDVRNLSRLQLALENVLEDAYARLANATDDNAIEVVEIALTYESITQSDYDKKAAIVDANSCLAANGYKVIMDRTYPPELETTYEDNKDDMNGILVKSEYDFSVNSSDTEIILYYKDLAVEKKNDSVVVFTDNNYYFAFDEAWIENSEHTIYIRTPKNEDNLYGCYRAELNSTVASDIELVKVFRYSDI